MLVLVLAVAVVLLLLMMMIALVALVALVAAARAAAAAEVCLAMLWQPLRPQLEPRRLWTVEEYYPTSPPRSRAGSTRGPSQESLREPPPQVLDRHRLSP